MSNVVEQVNLPFNGILVCFTPLRQRRRWYFLCSGVPLLSGMLAEHVYLLPYQARCGWSHVALLRISKSPGIFLRKCLGPCLDMPRKTNHAGGLARAIFGAPRAKLPATRTTYGAPQNIQKPLECAKNARVGHLRTVGYVTQVLRSDICTTPAQFRVGVIGLGIPRPHRGPQGVGS